MGAQTLFIQELILAIGFLWPVCSFLFLLAFVFYFIKKDWWPAMAIMAAVISEILILISPQEGGFATTFNLLVLIVSVPAFRKFRFRKKAKKEAEALLSAIDTGTGEVVEEEDLQSLPEIVQKWLRFSEVVGKREINAVALRQRGMMRTKPSGNWMPFNAVQYFDVKEPAFLWLAEVTIMPFIYLLGRDKLRNGEGEMFISLLAVVNLVKEEKNKKINSGAMLRFLAEMCWFPTAAVNKYISWESIDATSAKATLDLKSHQVSGIFRFYESGEPKSFEAQRYYGGGKNSKKEKWFIEMLDFKHISGIKIPYHCKVTWKLPDGDFNWLNLEITDLEYNPGSPYQQIKQKPEPV